MVRICIIYFICSYIIYWILHYFYSIRARFRGQREQLDDDGVPLPGLDLVEPSASNLDIKPVIPRPPTLDDVSDENMESEDDDGS